MRRPNLARPFISVTVLGLLASGCSYHGAKSLPLPGAIGSNDSYQVSIVLADATNLTPKETCRSNDAVIGSVESVSLDKDLRARVVCLIRDDVRLPANAVGRLSQTSLLGERFLALDPPAGVAPRGSLPHDAVIRTSATRIDPDVETVLGALSTVLNGGSLGSLETVTRELNAALSGADTRGTLKSVNRVVASLDAHRDDINASLTSLDRLTTILARQRRVLAEALESVPDGLAVLERERTSLVSTLQKLSKLSDAATPLINATRENTVADLRHLAAVLAQLSKASDELALTLSRVTTFPFPSTVLSTVKGDFAGMYGTIDLDVDLLNRLLSGSTGTSEPASRRSRVPDTSQTISPLSSLSPQLGHPSRQGIDGLLNGVLGGPS